MSAGVGPGAPAEVERALAGWVPIIDVDSVVDASNPVRNDIEWLAAILEASCHSDA